MPAGLLLALALLGPSACISARVQNNSAPSGRQVLVPSPSPLPYFSPAVRVGDLVFLSGQIGVKPGTREIVEGGIEAETRQTLENIKALLRGIGLDLSDAAKCTVFLADIADYATMNRIYQGYFPESPPARSTLAASGLALGARIEIECIAATR
jgi:2-iminobutanoate/2-iminopropanoate deaminase